MNSATVVAASIFPSSRRCHLALVAAALGFACGVAQAQVTPVNWYHFGENDGVAVGQPLATASDTVGTKPLTVVGNSLVSSDVGATAVSALGSARSLQFTTRNTDFARIAPATLTTITDNFGLELWVKPLSTSTSDQVIAYNGYFGLNGFGIVLKASDNKFYGQIGATTFGGATATIGTWTHLAIVRSNGIALLYVNGASVGANEFTAPSPPSIGFSVGNGLPAATYGLHGVVDELRFFTFAPNTFFASQLLTGARNVNTAVDTGGPGSLRYAMQSAGSGDTISISVAGPIAPVTPLPLIFGGVNIYGLAPGGVTLSGSNARRVFFVDIFGGMPATIGDVSIINGHAIGGAGGGGQFAGGGGMGAGGGLLINRGDVVLKRVSFSGNAATGGKGGNSGSGSGSTGGGGGAGGAGGTASASGAAAGGGGLYGAGGTQNTANGSSGGGGWLGNGGQGGAQTGGGGGANTNGGNGTNLVGGAGANGIGGKGGDNAPAPPAIDGVDGTDYGGGGGGAFGGHGGNGGRFAGGGGAYTNAAGAGGDYGGSGGGAVSGTPPNGGFGGGSGGEFNQSAGNGGFGGGSGGSDSVGGGVPGAFAGKGGVNSSGAGGGGGAALGGAIFLRANNGASLTWEDGGADTGTLTGGAGGTGSGAGNVGSTSGSSMFVLGGTTTINVTAGTRTISGSIGGPSNDPPNFTKIGTGTLVLAGGGSNLGVITANKGELRVNFGALNLAAGKELDVNNTATLTGNLGTVNGAVKVATGGTVAPGDPTNAAGVGTFTLGDFTWNAGGYVAYQMGSTPGISSDQFNVGNLTKAGSGSFRFNLADGSGSPICGNTYTLITYAGTTNFAASDFSYTYSGLSGIAPASSFSVGGNKVQFTVLCFNNQTITNFVAIPANPPYVSGGTFGVDANPGGGSGTLTYGSNTPAVCSVVGALVTMHSRGVCTLTANQAGDSNFNPAPTVFLTLHFEQYSVNFSAGPNGNISPPTSTVDYNASANFVVTPNAGFTAQVTADTCSVTHLTGDNWTTGAITTPCNVTATFIDRIFAAGFE